MLPLELSDLSGFTGAPFYIFDFDKIFFQIFLFFWVNCGDGVVIG